MSDMQQGVYVWAFSAAGHYFAGRADALDAAAAEIQQQTQDVFGRAMEYFTAVGRVELLTAPTWHPESQTFVDKPHEYELDDPDFPMPF